MSEKPRSLEEKRVDDLEDILGDRLRIVLKTKYGICNLSEHPDCYTLRIVDEYSRPLALFKIDFSGEIIGEFDNSQIQVWKDPRQEIPLTPEDLIDELYEAN